MLDLRHLSFSLACFLVGFLPIMAEEKNSTEELIAQLGDDKFQKRQEASETLRKMGAKAIPALTSATQKSDLEVSHRSLQLLYYFFYNGDSYTENLARNAIIEISNTNPEFYNLTFNILREPSEIWLKNVNASLVRGSNSDPNMTKVVLRGNRVNDEGVRNLQYFPELTHLEFHNTAVTSKGLLPLKKLTNIKSFSIRNEKITDRGMNVLFYFTKLTHLDIAQTQITDKGLEIISDLKTIKTLNASSTKISNEGVKKLEKLSALEQLNLDNTHIDDDCLPTLIKLSKLTHLSFKNTKIKGIKCSRNILSAIEEKPGTIQTNHKILLKSIYGLGHSETNKNILTTLKNISESHPNNNMQVNNLIESLCLIWLKSVGAISETNASNISLEHTKVDDFGLSHIKYLRNLTDLKIAGNAQITDKGLKQLSELNSLVRLTINLKNITDEGLQVLENFTEVTFLDLNHTQITDEGLKHLKKMNKLKTLHLDHTKVNGSGFKDLDYFSRTYFAVSLNGTGLTDENLMLFKDKIKYGRIYTSKSKVTPQGREALKKAIRKNGKSQRIVIN